MPLADLGRWTGGGTPSKSRPEYWSGSIPWVSPKDMKVARIRDAEDHISEAAVRQSSTNVVPAGSLLIVTRSGILSHTLPVAVTEASVALNQDLKALTPKSDVDPTYVYWALRGLERHILHYCSKDGTTVASIDTARLMRIEISLPSFEAQRRIVLAIEEQLSRLEAAVQSMKAAQVRVSALRKSVYRYMLQGEWPYVPLATVVQPDRPISYGILMPKENVLNGVPYVRVKDMKADAIDIEGLRRTSRAIADVYRRSMLRGGDVLISIRGTYGRVALVPDQLDGANITQDTARVAPGPKVLASYVAAVLRAPASQAYMRRVARGVAVKGVNLADLKVLPIPLPPLETQERLVEAVQEQVDRIVRFDAVVTTALRRAKPLRQSILNAAFTGRLVKGMVASQTDRVPQSGHMATPAGLAR